MPVQTGKSKLLAKYGNRLKESATKHAQDPVDYGFQKLPPGIVAGVAKLVKCGFEQFKPDTKAKKADGSSAAGEFYFTATGVVIEPESVTLKDGQKVTVKGMQTSIMETVCDTKDSKGNLIDMDTHVANIQNEMKKLGVEDPADIEASAEALTMLKPFFRFSTSEGKPSPQYPEPRTFENWNGIKGLTDYVPPDSGDAVNDQSGGSPADNGQVNHPGGQHAPSVNGDGTPDLDALLAAANEGNEEAQAELQQAAIAASGKTQEEVEALDTWEEVAALAKEEGDVGGNEAGAADADELPNESCVGQIYFYKMRDAKGEPLTDVDKKTKKKVERPGVEIEVVSVNADKKTVTIKDTTTKKMVLAGNKKPLNVPWDDILGEP